MSDIIRKSDYSPEEIRMINIRRTEEYKLDISTEQQLQILNNELYPINQKLIKDFKKPLYPVTFIVGIPRSGSSLLYQIVTGTGEFAYISNFSARFWKAPYIGVLLEKILEIRKKNTKISFRSEYGKTNEHLHSPHEFMYFWDRWFALGQEEQHLSERLLMQVDGDKLAGEIASIEHVWNKPVVLKSLFWLSLQMDFLAGLFENSIFISTKRNPLYIMQSIVIGRKEIKGDINTWWSIKPKEYKELLKLPWYDQVAGQVYYSLESVNESFMKLPENRKILLDYRALCEEPENFLDKLQFIVNQKGGDITIDKKYLKRFTPSDRQKLSDREFKLLIGSYRRFFGEKPEIANK